MPRNDLAGAIPVASAHVIVIFLMLLSPGYYIPRGVYSLAATDATDALNGDIHRGIACMNGVPRVESSSEIL